MIDEATRRDDPLSIENLKIRGTVQGGKMHEADRLGFSKAFMCCSNIIFLVSNFVDRGTSKSKRPVLECILHEKQFEPCIV